MFGVIYTAVIMILRLQDLMDCLETSIPILAILKLVCDSLKILFSSFW